jgi:hypothetical protein
MGRKKIDLIRDFTLMVRDFTLMMSQSVTSPRNQTNQDLSL